MIKPPALVKGDKIGLVAPARKITPEEILPAVEIFRDQGFVPFYNEDLFIASHQFAGEDRQRTGLVQRMLDDPEVKAVFSVRGGYGSARIIDMLDFSGFIDHPKWFVGYSDVTVFHAHLNHVCGVQTLHASMPLNFADNTKTAIDLLFETLQGEMPSYQFDSHSLNRKGKAKGVLTGGNLSVLYSLLGSRSFPDTKGKILFIEDLDEYLYHVDRMMVAFKRAGVLSGLRGLVVGGMTEMNNNEIPFGKTAEQIVREAVDDYAYPVCFGFPAGHLNNNLPLIMGGLVRMEVTDEIQINFEA